MHMPACFEKQRDHWEKDLFLDMKWGGDKYKQCACGCVWVRVCVCTHANKEVWFYGWEWCMVIVFSKTTSQRSTSFLALHTQSHKPHMSRRESTHTHTHTHTKTQINLDIIPLCLRLGLTDLSHTHSETHTYNLPSNGTRDASIVWPTFFTFSLYVSNPCLSSWQVPAAGEPGCGLMIRVGRMDTWSGTNLRSCESLMRT